MTKVTLRVKTFGLPRGAEVEVDDERAEALVANGHALLVAEPEPEKKSSKKG